MEKAISVSSLGGGEEQAKRKKRIRREMRHFRRRDDRRGSRTVDLPGLYSVGFRKPCKQKPERPGGERVWEAHATSLKSNLAPERRNKEGLDNLE